MNIHAWKTAVLIMEHVTPIFNRMQSVFATVNLKVKDVKRLKVRINDLANSLLILIRKFESC